MKTFERIKQRNDGKIFGIETTFVLFFLAIEFGQTADFFAIDSLFLAATLLMLIVLPYLLSGNEGEFGKWVLGRTLIAGFAVVIGAMFRQSLGIVLPQTLSFLPMTLLILAAMLSCYIQFYSFFKLRPAK